ncbi:prolyl oligopeptidase family protein [Streptomyces sp. NPDC004111]|uniref:prolyl oligopeptidase family serine peptidase n=1 Tax=Streptomyces sp. NPDC004111 TaxID=3364690 RepID=UPI0036925813
MIADDPYLWLEDIEGPDALAWVRERTAECERVLEGPEFDKLSSELREVLDDARRIPYVRRRGELLYDFRRDATHVRGVWRRTTLAEYRKDEPEWETVLDIDALAEAEGVDWVWDGARVRYPDHRRALVRLSPSGTDAVVVREFDMVEREFVPEDATGGTAGGGPAGFRVPEGKTRIGWIDEDTVFLGADLGPDSLTTSGYPRTVRRWRRGTPHTEAALVFEAARDDLSVTGWRDPTPGYVRDFLAVHRDFWHQDLYLLGDGDRLTRIDVPDDATAYAHREWLIVSPRSEWLGHPAGSLLAFGFDAFLAGAREAAVLFTPTARTALEGHSWTRDHLILEILTDVATSIEILTPGAPPAGTGAGAPAAWSRRPLTDVPPLASATVTATDPDSDEYFLAVDGFLQPPTLYRGEATAHPGGAMEQLKQSPALFDTTGLAVRQHFATSDDGTRVPYFVIGPAEPTGPTPTLLYGYGGFEHTQTPGYGALRGRGWLALGGTYVIAGIRGGGEYGPAWHRAALKANRPRAFEDFAAVARDLVARNLTTPDRLGIEGRSNGGLLIGAMLARYPELFGAAIIGAPILDLRRYHLLLAGASWIAEYGDPDDPADRPHIDEISPYHNLHADRGYPPTLLYTATSDDRVHPGHARKTAALLRAQGHEVLFHETPSGGHSSAADNAQSARLQALKYTFLRNTLGERRDQDGRPGRRGNGPNAPAGS